MSGTLPDLAVRGSTDRDVAAIAEIYAHHVTHGSASFEEIPPDLAEVAARRTRIVGRGWPWLVAERDGLVVGYAYIGSYRERSAYRFTCEDSVYVRPGEEGRGIGRALLGPLLEHARQAGFREVIAVIGDSANVGSISLHRALGFRMVGTLQGVGVKFGRRLDSVLMQRGLDAVA